MGSFGQIGGQKYVLDILGQIDASRYLLDNFGQIGRAYPKEVLDSFRQIGAKNRFGEVSNKLVLKNRFVAGQFKPAQNYGLNRLIGLLQATFTTRRYDTG